MMGGVAPGAGLGGDRVWRSARNTPKMDSFIPTFPEKIMSAHLTPEQVRSKIDHPIVDGDGHWVEYDPVFSDKMRKVGGDLAGDGFLKAMGTTREILSMSVAERRHKRIGQQAFWARQAENTLDRATAMMPKLLYDRLDELGLDFVVVYPTAGLRFPRIADDATRRAVIRAYNVVSADYFSGLGDRLTPAAIIPMHTPDEAIAELAEGHLLVGAGLANDARRDDRPQRRCRRSPARVRGSELAD